MISKIIIKEKEAQKLMLETLYQCPFRKKESCTTCKEVCIRLKSHKQSLINLKEYMEDVRINISKLNLSLVEIGIRIQLFNMMKVLTEDIDELTKMIERYE